MGSEDTFLYNLKFVYSKVSKMTEVIRRKFVSQLVSKRMMSMLKAHRKRFYKDVDIKSNKGGYVIQIDNKTLKTPLLKPLQAPTKPLAMAIAQEWHMQIEEINIHTMPLTSICNTAIDNPTGITKIDLIATLLQFLHTDTVCAVADEPEKLVQFQEKHWTPLRKWFSKRYEVTVNASSNLFTLSQSDETINKLTEVLKNQSTWQLYALQSAIDCTKSFIIPVAVFDYHINVEDAVYLARLEQEFQIKRWGKFEGAHDIDMYNTRSQLAAAALFCHLSTEKDLEENDNT